MKYPIILLLLFAGCASMPIEEVKDPKTTAKFLATNINYVQEYGEDKWQSPEETLIKGYGDCEDFALLAQSILKEKGYETKLISVAYPKTSHAFLLVKEGDEWNVIDMWNYLKGGKTVDEAVKKTRPEAEGYSIRHDDGLIGLKVKMKGEK